MSPCPSSDPSLICCLCHFLLPSWFMTWQPTPQGSCGLTCPERCRATAAETLGKRTKSYIIHPTLPTSSTCRAALWGQPPSRAGLQALHGRPGHYKTYHLRTQDFDIYLFPFILIFTLFPLKSARHSLSYKLSDSVCTLWGSQLPAIGNDLNFQSKRQKGSHIPTPAGVVKLSSRVFPFNLYQFRALIWTWRKQLHNQN